MHAITNNGWVKVITGCIFSGKTEELLRRIRRAEIADKMVAAFTSAIDDRYGTATIGSHVGRRIEALVVDSDHWGDDIHEGLNGHEVVVVDEANFFSERLVCVCEELAADGRRIVISGTDQTFPGEPFVPIPSCWQRQSTSRSSGPSAPSAGARDPEPAAHRG